MWTGLTQMRSRHHRAQRRLDRTLRVGQKTGDTGKGLIRFGIEDMKNGADQERVAGLLPVIAPFERAVRINQYIGDVLHVAHFPFAAPHF